jgi:hypothetical protein
VVSAYGGEDELLRLASGGSATEQQRIAQLPELPTRVLEELVKSEDQTVLVLLTYRTDIPPYLVARLEDGERARLADGSGFGLDQNIGNMAHASTDFRLRMPLEFLDDDLLRQTLDVLQVEEALREKIEEQKDRGTLLPLGEVIRQLTGA